METVLQTAMEAVKKNHPERNIIMDPNLYDGPDWENKSFIFDPPPSRSVLPQKIEYKYSFIKKNGSESNLKKETVSMIPSFCCFCGESLLPAKSEHHNGAG